MAMQSAASRDANALQICIYTHHLTYGGAELQIISLANKFASVGHLVTLCAGKVDPDVRSLVSEPVRLVILSTARTASDTMPLWRHVRRTKPQYLIATIFRCNLVASIVRFLTPAGPRLVLRETTVKYHRLTSAGSVILHKLGYNFMSLVVDRVVVPNRSMLDGLALLSSRYRERAVVVSNPARVEFRPASDAPISEPARLVFVGRLEPVKRVERLLEAISRLDSKTFQLDVYGDGSQRAALVHLCGKLGLQDSVTFHGFSSDVGSIYRQGGTLVVCSDYEGFPNVVVEAAASGLGIAIHGSPEEYGDLPRLLGIRATSFSRDKGLEAFTEMLRRAVCEPHELLPSSIRVKQFCDDAGLAALRLYLNFDRDHRW